MMPPVAATIDEDFNEDFHKKKRNFLSQKFNWKTIAGYLANSRFTNSLL